ncbi:PAS domain-containing sensor histidine kinase [Nitratidesulfovibrio sp. SRB-5]|uniref:sensor histidine kinase n=1 Tax=Nitratidesulfovibrio sp. SRB-5 TaxID=2872636 RepID=UPI001027C80D|nr:PAS domain-containing sensor histidine kinase [Nitratidesulfovibrio sp. SRB-5]MBZ2172072.1 two-component sensor histidine kinase [Nitratidesulfovibrio sp. SRB-5]RXF76024.1 two-component sensor histidine kinase [Desulfovibrio sp. DS-1]
MSRLERFRSLFRTALDVPEEIAPERYQALRRKITLLLTTAAVVPLLILSVINYHQYRATLTREIVTPVRGLVNKTRHSFELFLAERASTVSLISQVYTPAELADERNLNRIFRAVKGEFPGFIDLGLINENGVHASYVGPYNLKGKDYSSADWYQQTRVKGVYVSDVFMGFRRFPHIVIAVQRMTDDGHSWVLRATIDTGQFDRLIASMGLEPESDAFLVNTAGVLQTASRFYGAVLDQLPLPMPPMTYETATLETTDPAGRDVFITYTYFQHADFVLMAVKPRADIFKPWTTLRSDLILLFVTSVALILSVAFGLTDLLVRRMRASDERRIAAFVQMEHTQKLSSIGRLAAGVAHEINNPLAIINEKAGLASDLMELAKDFPERDRFRALVDAILRSVERCRSITHRLLGFSRRMDVNIEQLDVNDVLKETMSFLEQEALHRSITTSVSLDPAMPRIASDRGQLQQVFLNILNNAFAAVPDGGSVTLATWLRDPDTVGVSIKDNGKGMSDEVLRHIFEPFFTTKKTSGTGLGMFITYGIIRRLGGDIAVQSKEGAGTTVTVFLPVKAAPTATLGS